MFAMTKSTMHSSGYFPPRFRMASTISHDPNGVPSAFVIVSALDVIPAGGRVFAIAGRADDTNPHAIGFLECTRLASNHYKDEADDSKHRYYRREHD